VQPKDRQVGGIEVKWGLPWPGADVARDAEAAGASAFCAGEYSDHDAYVTTTEMALTTSNAMVGTGIAYAFARSPFVHAAAVRNLNSLAPGRVFLGLGSGTPRMNRDWFSTAADRPALRMTELIEVIKTYLGAENGERIRYEGEFYTVDADIRAPVLGRLDVPIVIGAFNKYMVRGAGRSADGVLGHEIFTDRWWTEVIDPELARGAASVNRPATDFHRWGWLITAIDDEQPERAINEARLQIAFHLSVRTYNTLVELHGWQDEAAAIREALRSGNPADIGTHVTDDMLNAIAVCGDSEQAADMLKRRARLPELAFLAPPSFLVGRRRRMQYSNAAMRFAQSLT